ncbi:MAG: glycosyltransferase family A protein [Candidatus Omnitrophota bacterium]
MRVSVIILTKDKKKYFSRLVDTLFNQEFSGNFEGICVDSGSPYDIEDVCRQKGVKFYPIAPREFNHGLTRNFAAREAKGEFLVFLSQDALPKSSNWLKNLVAVLEKDEDIAGAYCRQEPREGVSCLIRWQIENHFPKESQIRWIKDKDDYAGFSPREKYRFCQFDNVSSCIRKRVWEKINFEKTDFGEDLRWSKRALEAGYKIAYRDDIAVIHSHQLGLAESYTRSYLNQRLLYDLFSYRTFPSFLSFIKNLVAFPLFAAAYCLRNEASLVLAIVRMPRVILSSFLSVLGQYFAAIN